MSIKDDFNVYSIPSKQAKPWILKKHYAGRMPSISYAFGLHKQKELVGVCTFGVSPNYIEDKAWKDYRLLELNRLITEDNLPKNALSYFVSKSLKKLPKPTVVISYADKGAGHNGYIYQATNWIYTGMGAGSGKEYLMADGSTRHQRTLWNKNKPDLIEKMKENGEIIDEKTTTGKHRYYYFVGNKREKRKMRELLRYQPKPYPKGDNKKYDTGDKLAKQQRLF